MTLEGGNIGFRPFLRNDPLNASLLPPFQTSRIQMELLSPERLREMTFLRSKKGGLPGSEGGHLLSRKNYREEKGLKEGC